jgi:hypothetical protein
MKKRLTTLFIAAALVSCGESKQDKTEVMKEVTALNYDFYGEKITDENVISATEMMAKYNTLKPGDTIALKFKAKVNEVCQAKGCWMQVAIADDKEAMVKFKDYGFFMPLDIGDQEVIMQGKAFVAEMSVDEQRHYAEDGGKTKEEVLEITEPKRTLSFTSSGVLIPKKGESK